MCVGVLLCVFVCVCVCVCVVWCAVHYTGEFEALHLTLKLAQTAFTSINSQRSFGNNSHSFLFVVHITQLYQSKIIFAYMVEITYI